MELGAFASALARRWYMVVVAVALAAGACAYTWSAVGATHESRSSVLLFPPERDAVSQDATGNPYLDLIGLNSARDILIRTLTSQSERDALGDAHPGADYRLAADATSSGPIILVEVSAPTGQEALAAQSMLLEDIPVALETLQAGLGLAPQELITVRVVTVDERTEAVHRSQLRAAIVASAFVIAIALVLIGLVDGLLAARPRSRRRTSNDETEPEGADRADKGGTPEDPDAAPDESADESPEAAAATAPEAEPVPVADEQTRRLNHKQARRLARREARDEALRVERGRTRELDRAGA